MPSKIIFFAILSFGISQTSLGQIPNKNLSTNELWTGITLKYEVNKKNTISLKQQFRTTDNLNEVRSNFFEIGFKHKLSKHISTKVHFRHTILNEQRNRNRYILDGTGEWKIKQTKVHIDYRLRMQESMVTYTGQPFTILRNKIQLHRKISKHSNVLAAFESFYQFNDVNNFNVTRYTLGFNYSIDKRMELNSYLRLDQEINVKKPKRQYIIGLLLSYKI
ncbi:MAG: hypothetical protein COA58_13385 [Bacteroidetes bacterium]|nr:MAG: hypothetical protein COA58_13385 [Bacteroidota bacterium]